MPRLSYKVITYCYLEITEDEAASFLEGRVIKLMDRAAVEYFDDTTSVEDISFTNFGIDYATI